MSESVVARKGSRGPSEAPSVAKSYAGAAFNALMEEASKESIVVMLLEAWDQKRELLAALKEFAKQELSADMSVDDQLGGDFEGAYNHMIELARAAVAKAEGVAPVSPAEGRPPPPSKDNT